MVLLGLQRAHSAVGQCTGMTHGDAFLGLAAGNEGQDGLFRTKRREMFGQLLFFRAADLANDDDGLGRGIIEKRLYQIGKADPLDAVTADADPEACA